MAGSPAESHGRERKSEIEKGARSCSEAVLRNLGIFYQQQGTTILSRSLSRTIINWADHPNTSVERHCVKH